MTREESIQAVFDLKVGYTLELADIEILKRVARIALAAMDSEPVAISHDTREFLIESMNDSLGQDSPTELDYQFAADIEKLLQPLYRHAQPAPERDQVRIAHAEWSQATFGNVGPVGPLKHLSKEALEAAAEPGDLSEWADMQFLLWDAQRRAGITDEQITQAMIEKLAVNKQRSWPEPKDGEPRLHINEQPAPEGHLSRICAESYQVVGALAEALGIFNDIGVIKALDNLSAQKLIHNDVLPFSVPEESQPATVVPDDVLEALQKVARIRLDMNDFDGDRRGIADCLSDAEEALIEVVNRRAAMLNGGKP